MKKAIALVAILAVLSPLSAFALTISPSIGHFGSAEVSWSAEDCPVGGAYTPYYTSDDESAPFKNDGNACGAVDEPVGPLSVQSLFGSLDATDAEMFATIGYNPCGVENNCTITVVNSTADCTATDLATCLATAISYDEYTWTVNFPGFFGLPDVSAPVTANISDTLADPGTLALFVMAIGVPLLFYVIRRIIETSPGAVVGKGYSRRGGFMVREKLGVRYRDYFKGNIDKDI